jgi:molecular chaperone DnaK
MSDTAVGIDLGTSNSVITVELEGEPIVLPDEEGHRIHPSVVHLGEDGQTRVGHEATEYRINDPTHTVYSVKRLMGRTFNDPDVKVLMGEFPYPIVESDDGTPHIDIHDQLHPPEGISARILHYLRRVAEDYMGDRVKRAVITVPANFDEAQRRATQQAAELAGLEVMRLLNEPTAAALAYGYGEGKRERVAIYDFGGGTFDISILELRDNVFQVVSTAGDSYLGGDDLDYRIVSMILNAFEKQHGYDLSGDETVQQRLKAVAQQIKHKLTDQQKVRARITEYVPGSLDELDLEFEITRDEFERRCRDIVEESLETCEEALEVAGLQRAEIDHLVMVGGTTRVPLVQDEVRNFFNRDPVLDINPDEVVSIGAALFASTLADEDGAPPVSKEMADVSDESGSAKEIAEKASDEQEERPLLIDVTPHALGIKTVGGVMDIIIERNGSLPLERSRTFSPSRDDQTRVVLPIFSGNSRRVEHNRRIGQVELEDLPPRAREEAEIKVAFSVDTDGMLSIEATDTKTGKKQTAELSILGVGDEEDLETREGSDEDLVV